MDIDIVDVYLKTEKGEKLKKICKDLGFESEREFNAIRQRLHRYRGKLIGGSKTPTTRRKRTKKFFLPSYAQFIQLCVDNPAFPFADQMFDNCEGGPRKHWRSMIKTTINMLKMMESEGMLKDGLPSYNPNIS